MESSSNPKNSRHLRSLSADAATRLQLQPLDSTPTQDELISSVQSPTVTDDLGITSSVGGWTVRTNEYVVVEETRREERQQQRLQRFVVESGNLKGRRLFEWSRHRNCDSTSDKVGDVSEKVSIEDARRGLEMDGEVDHDSIVEHRCSGSEGSSEEESSWKCGHCYCCCCCCYSCSFSGPCENEREAVAVKELKESEIVKENKADGSVSGGGRRRILWVVSGTCVVIAVTAAVLSIVRSFHGVEYGKVGVGLVPT